MVGWLWWASAMIPVAMAQGEPWILVDTSTATLSVMRGGQEIKRFANIAIGRGGATDRRMRGDQSTPVGLFRVAWIENDTRFRRFYGLDYPSISHAKWARDEGIIDAQTYRAIKRARRSRKVPPQDTALGGYLGIHGLGGSDPRVHEQFHWTQGCVAVTNQQLDALGAWITEGTRVIIR